MKICITSIGTATSIGLIKYIRKYDPDIQIVGTDINEYGYTAGSLLVDKYYVVPLATDKEYVKEITGIIESEKIDVLIPVNDSEIKRIAESINLIDSKCIIPDIDTINLVNDKLLSTKKVNEIGIKVPGIVDMTYHDKCIIRDRVGVGSKGIHVLRSGDTSIDVLENQFVQEYVTGIEYTVDILCDCDGKPLYIIPRQRLEIKAGVATKVLIDYNVEIIEQVKKILAKIKLPGFTNIQFIADADENIWFIEINPRIGGCTSSSLLAAPGMFDDFMAVISGKSFDNINIEENLKKVKWGSIVTRYYEEVIYEKNN